MKLILIKLGGSVITNKAKQNTAKIKVINRLLSEIHRALNSDKKIRIILGHGSGSFGHMAAHKYKINLGLINKKSLEGASITQNAAAKLHRIIFDQGIKNKLNFISFAPSSSVLSKNSKIVSWDLKALKFALGFGFIPLTYGDIAIDSKLGVSIVSTEEVFRYLSYELNPYKIIAGSDIDGVLDINNNSKLIKTISERNFDEVFKIAANSKNIDVTGGMKSKVDYLYKIAKHTGAQCQIINANKPGRLYNSILDKNVIGTRIIK
ncbi:MAG: isopentenyl phosphate kinase [Candidatus Marsarchaeota archaeon]|nr:isopentenyl phosphate kinase [Candidatus Marsarchaeota archaeon]MCL5094502.1 isopentenyl phosphate kinase [Candidatus Marsarchaeota archaeon]